MATSTTTAGRTTATAVSRVTTRARVTIGVVTVTLVAVALIVALAGGRQSSHRQPGRFAWLHPASPPVGWSVAHASGGATLGYPPAWKAIESDAGTASVALLRGGDRIPDQIAAYLNVTPKQGPETLGNWTRFRLQHNRGEGNRNVHLIASAQDLSFRSGRGSCVIDDYKTSKAAYREIACIVSSSGSTGVVVAAAPRGLWDQQAATLERAVSSFVP
jgi:hypothetical protein